MSVFLIIIIPLTCAYPSTKTIITELEQNNKPQSLMPFEQGKVMLIIGQDLDSIASYINAELPYPIGVITYLSFYNLLNSKFPAYGALGEDTKGNKIDKVVDWGAGPLNAAKLVEQYPNSALVIGLHIAEGNQHQTWASGGLADIGVGHYDKHIQRLARFFKTLNQPIYLRIGYEFDGAWNKGYEKPSNYIYAYRHIVDVIRKEDVNNIAFVWQASASPIDDIIDGYHENIKDWYPGDNYVDWLGLSWFLEPNKKHHNVMTQKQLADEVLKFAREKHKPVMIAEAAPQGYDLSNLTKSNISPLWDGLAGKNKTKVSADEIWKTWFMPFFAYIIDNIDVIAAVSYINANWNEQKLWNEPYQNGYWGNSKIEANPDIKRLWQSEISNNKFWLYGKTK